MIESENSSAGVFDDDGADDEAVRLGLAEGGDSRGGEALTRAEPAATSLTEPAPDGGRRGADPRALGADALRAAGLQAASPLAAIRAKCLDCCAGAPSEVRACTAMACALWPFRMRKNPWRAPPSEARREAARQRFAARRGAADLGADQADADEEEAEDEAEDGVFW